MCLSVCPPIVRGEESKGLMASMNTPVQILETDTGGGVRHGDTDPVSVLLEGRRGREKPVEVEVVGAAAAPAFTSTAAAAAAAEAAAAVAAAADDDDK